MLKRINLNLNIGRSKTQTKGFTIIETTIVLAIAGLILTIVLLAVPALEREQHNMEQRSDVALIKTALLNYYDSDSYGNNFFPWPGGAGIGGGCWIYVDNGGSVCPNAYDFFKKNILPADTYYTDMSQIFYATDFPSYGFGTRDITDLVGNSDEIFIDSSSVCVGESKIEVSSNVNTEIIAYIMENNGNDIPQCVSVLDN